MHIKDSRAHVFFFLCDIHYIPHSSCCSGFTIFSEGYVIAPKWHLNQNYWIKHYWIQWQCAIAGQQGGGQATQSTTEYSMIDNLAK